MIDLIVASVIPSTSETDPGGWHCSVNGAAGSSGGLSRTRLGTTPGGETSRDGRSRSCLLRRARSRGSHGGFHDVPRRQAHAERTGRTPTSELIKVATEQFSHLIRDEVRLARAEMVDTGRRAGRGMGLLGGAALAALFGLAGLLTALALILALVMPAWLAVLVVAIALLLPAGLLGLVGYDHVRQAAHAVPTRAVSGVKADFDTLAEALKNRGHGRAEPRPSQEEGREG